ncbi:MAG: PatB family C-S lyase [Firmicutes bacterium]|jgi:cystathionine beta-lyase|nr:PatB family C-S lyase [Bacillota bacterium]
MTYFDKDLKRKGTSEKWSDNKQRLLFTTDNLHPMWIADMEFMTVPNTLEDLKNRISEGHFGYEINSDNFFDSFIDWYKKRHQWDIKKRWINPIPSVSTAIPILIDILTNEGDGVIIQTPVYHMFSKNIKSMNRKLYKNPLIVNDQYTMDFESLEDAMKLSKLLIIANPHNPVGRVWTYEELIKLSNLALKYNVKVISDEIHRDILLHNKKMENLMTYSKEISNNTITLLSPGKTFNISGQSMAVAIITNKDIKDKFNSFIHKYHLNHNNILNNIAFSSAYENGSDWLDKAINYIESNLDTLKSFIASELPSINLIQGEGTYLVWLDMRKIESDPHKLLDLISKSGIAVDSGHWYGREGAGFIRMNIACPKAHLVKALELLKSGLDKS